MSAGLHRMREARRSLAILALAFLAVFMAVESPQAFEEMAVEELAAGEMAVGDKAGPAIWMATRGQSTVYIFGTIHILEPGKVWFTEKIRSRFNSAHTLALEMADLKGQGGEAKRLIRQLGVYPPRDSLASHIGERTYMRLQSTMSRLGAPPVALYRMRPWVALMVFSIHALASDGQLLKYGADRTLHRLALQQNKRVIGLESMEAHLRTFADMPEDVQIQMLKKSLEGLNKRDPTYQPLVDSWLLGNVEELGRVMAAGFGKRSPIISQRLLIDRNRNWIKPIERMLSGNGTYFIAAGAGHFAGQGNVIDLLRARGVTVVRE